MDLDWEALADALAASPTVAAFAAGEGRDCRATGVERWISLRDGATTIVCTREKGTTECRARLEHSAYLGCFGWGELRPTEAPQFAAPLIAVWEGAPALEATPDTRDLPPGSPLTAVSVFERRVVGGELDGTTRLALLTATGWHLSREAIDARESVQYAESFDATSMLSGSGWGVISSSFDGCSRGGSTAWNLRLWREDGAWLTLASRLDLGSSSFWVDDDGRRRRHGVRLGVTPLAHGRLRLRVVWNMGGPGAKEVRSKVGVWSMVEDGLEPTK